MTNLEKKTTLMQFEENHKGQVDLLYRKLLKDELKHEFLELLAALEHEQWVKWSQEIAETEVIQAPRLERWKKLWVPYEELSEEDKDKDRYWAERVLDIRADELPLVTKLINHYIEENKHFEKEVKVWRECAHDWMNHYEDLKRKYEGDEQKCSFCGKEHEGDLDE